MLCYFFLHRITKDEGCIMSLMEMIESMVNPWDCEYGHLTSLSSGAVAADDVSEDVTNAHSLGEEKLRMFFKDRLVNKSEDVFSNIKSLQLKTFKHSKGEVVKKTPLKEAKTERSMFARMILVAKQPKGNIDIFADPSTW